MLCALLILTLAYGVEPPALKEPPAVPCLPNGVPVRPLLKQSEIYKLVRAGKSLVVCVGIAPGPGEVAAKELTAIDANGVEFPKPPGIYDVSYGPRTVCFGDHCERVTSVWIVRRPDPKPMAGK